MNDITPGSGGKELRFNVESGNRALSGQPGSMENPTIGVDERMCPMGGVGMAKI